MEFDFVVERINLIAKIIDRNNPDITPIEVFANDVEYELYAEAYRRATGTGWAVHLAQDRSGSNSTWRNTSKLSRRKITPS